MKYYILASVILFGFLIHRANRLNRKEHDRDEKTFWEKENAANNVRRKSLDGLSYITLPKELLDLIEATLAFINSKKEKDSDEEDFHSISECMNSLKDLADRKIVNFTGISNTDLKLEYGTANITVLTEYDQNYTLLARSLNQWGSFLKENDKIQDAKSVFEFAISTGTDISNTFYELAEIYAKDLEFSKIEHLSEIAEELPSANRMAIVRHLQESYL